MITLAELLAAASIGAPAPFLSPPPFRPGYYDIHWGLSWKACAEFRPDGMLLVHDGEFPCVGEWLYRQPQELLLDWDDTRLAVFNFNTKTMTGSALGGYPFRLVWRGPPHRRR